MSYIDWSKVSLDSEIEYSKALGSTPIKHSNFIHMYSSTVPWSGDFNRAVGVQVTDFQSFEAITLEVEDIHKQKGLEKPSRYDLISPEVDNSVWGDHLQSKGYRSSTAIFFNAPPKLYDLPFGFSLSMPSQDDYMDWFHQLVQSRGYYEKAWFQKIKPIQINFAKVFKPYWLLKEGDLVGWVYCANLGSYARLFEVEIQTSYRGKGMGKLLLQAIRMEGHKMGVEFILLQASEGLRRFYENSGFSECSRNSIIWLNE